MDEKDVQTGAVSVETPSNEVIAPPAPPALKPDDIQKMIDAGIERAKQAARDSARSEVEKAQRKSAQADVLSEAALRQLEQDNPEAAVKLRRAQLDALRNQANVDSQQEQFTQQQVAFHNSFWANIDETLGDMGLTLEEIKMDIPSLQQQGISYLEAQKRILKAAAGVIKERHRTAQATEQELATIKRDANSVSSPAGGGGSSGAIPTDMEKFRAWIASIPQSEYERKYAAKVSELMREGKIK